MKRMKGLGLSICAIALAAIIFFGGAGLSTFVMAKADTEAPPPAPVQGEFFKGTVEREVELGDSFSVPTAKTDVEISVKAPNGFPIEPVSGKIVANQLGNYTVEVKDTVTGKTTYSYNVYCSMTNEYSIYIDYDGAKIPTFMKTNGSFVVPNAFLKYTDEYGKLAKYTPAAGQENDMNGFNVTVTGSENTKTRDAATGDITVTAKERGTLVLKYSISISEGKFYSKEFKITVQDVLTTSKPKLAISGVPSSANVNTKVTLPIATATSSYDAKVYVEVKVWHESLKNDSNKEGYAVEMTEEEIDEKTGYARPGANYKSNAIVEFDNLRTMSFYPTELGTYRVSYQAIDTAGEFTTPYNFTITVTDSLAPLFVDFDRTSIPTNWGLNVKNDTDQDVSTAFFIPLPDVRDNKDGLEDLTLVVTVRNKDNTSILRFTNALHALSELDGKEGHIAKNSKYDNNEPQEFEWDDAMGAYGVWFDLEKYEAQDKIGTYTVDYRVEDASKRGRTYSPAISVSVANDFEDTNAPQIDAFDSVRYILLGKGGDKTFEVPNAIVSDDHDANPTINYILTFTPRDGDATNATVITLKSGEVLDIVEELDGTTTKFFLANSDGKLKIGENTFFEIGDGTLTLDCTATDDVGNIGSITKPLKIDVYPTEDKNQKTLTLTQKFNFPVGSDVLRVDNLTNPTKYLDDVNLGGFVVEGANDVGFAGFEILLKSPTNATVPVSLDRLIDHATKNIHVYNLKFVPKVEGMHDLYIRIFDVNGTSTLYRYSFNIVGSIDTDNPYAKSATIPTTGGSTQTKYALKGNFLKESTSAYSIARVSGNHFSLIGNDFIANATGSYKFQEFWIAQDNHKNLNVAYNEDKLNLHATYSTTINASEKPVIEVLGNMPVYSPKSSVNTNDRNKPENVGKDEATLVENGWVVLPSVTAFNNRQNATISVKVTDKDSITVNAFKLYQQVDATAEGGYIFGFFEDDDAASVAGYHFANRWAFAPQKNGTTTVTYTASLNNKNDATASYSILVGKIAGPSVTLTTTAKSSYAINSEFKFSTIQNVVDETMTASEIKSYTFVKKLIGPSGNEIAKVTGSNPNDDATVNNGTKITLEMSGTYTVVYEVTDIYGNKTTINNYFQVSDASRGVTTSMKMLSVILIIVAILLLAGAVFYIIRFRSVKRIKD